MSLDTMWQLIERHKVTIMILAPSRVAAMVQNKRPENIDISSLRCLIFGGSTFSREMLKAARAMLPTSMVLTGYGQTEAGGGVISFQLKDADDYKIALQKVMSSGQVSSGVIIKVTDVETGKTLGPNQQGEIRIKSEYNMNGYYNLDDSDQWDEDGFMKSGDLGYYDEDKFFYIIDRIKEMFKFRGWQIAPIKIESIIMNHPAVETAIVIGIPHPVDNEHPMAIVTLKKSYEGNVTCESIKQFVDNQVDDKYKLRVGVRTVKELVQTLSEKYKRKYLKDLVLAGKL